MSLWRRHVLPHLVRSACGARSVERQREKIVPRATGRVLEIGAGGGMNLPFYDPTRVEHVLGVDPSEPLLEDARRAAAHVTPAVTLVRGTAESLPAEDDSIDTVLVTYTLCSVDDLDRALAEVRRVLKPDGRLLFCEHGLAPDPEVRLWQRRLGPVWRRIGGGCRLDRDLPRLVENAGFAIDDLETLYLPGLRFMTFNYWGAATPRARA